MNLFSGPPSLVPRPDDERMRVYIVVCHNYDDSWICGCFVDDPDKATSLQNKLGVEAEHYGCPGNDPRYFIETWRDGELKK